MILQNITFEELHDSVIGSYYDFTYLRLYVFNEYNLEFIQKGKLQVDTITSNVISLNIYIGKKRICQAYVFNDNNFSMTIGFNPSK